MLFSEGSSQLFDSRWIDRHNGDSQIVLAGLQRNTKIVRTGAIMAQGNYSLHDYRETLKYWADEPWWLKGELLIKYYYRPTTALDLSFYLFWLILVGLVEK